MKSGPQSRIKKSSKSKQTQSKNIKKIKILFFNEIIHKQKKHTKPSHN